MKPIILVVTLISLAVTIGGASAQPAQGEYPSQPVRYIVPFPPGGGTDIIARVVAGAMSEGLGEQVVIDNRGGAGGTIGADIAARAAPDGYTLFACNIASLAVSPALYRKLAYDADTAFAPIGLIGSNPNTLAVHPSLPVKTVAQFIAFAKSRPGQLNYASAGVGTSPQLSMEMFKKAARIDVVHVSYRGAGPALIDLMGGHVHSMFTTVPSIIGAIRSGAVRVLAVTSKTRTPDLPDVPTLDETGMPGFEVISWQGLCTPAGVAEPVLARLRTELAAALAAPETRKQLAAQGIEPTPLTAEKFGAFIRAERAKWAKIVKDLGIPPR